MLYQLSYDRVIHKDAGHLCNEQKQALASTPLAHLAHKGIHQDSSLGCRDHNATS